ncbi:MAG: NUDIX hydrolase [Gammaproteobacteria bacterium]
MSLPIQARFSINILENDLKEILLLKRRAQAKLGPGLWGFPAGHMREEEDPAHCSLREMHEEIGNDIVIYLLREFGPVRDTFYGGIYEVHLFHYHWHSGSIALNEEHTAYAWVGPESYKYYNVMDGIDEDLAYLNIWPKKYLHPDKLPAHLR